MSQAVFGSINGFPIRTRILKKGAAAFMEQPETETQAIKDALETQTNDMAEVKERLDAFDETVNDMVAVKERLDALDETFNDIIQHLEQMGDEVDMLIMQQIENLRNEMTAAIDTLTQRVDQLEFNTNMLGAALNGGETGQVLTKVSNDDLDVEWQTPTP